jgi:hypothetical protein
MNAQSAGFAVEFDESSGSETRCLLHHAAITLPDTVEDLLLDLRRDHPLIRATAGKPR